MQEGLSSDCIALVSICLRLHGIY